MRDPADAHAASQFYTGLVADLYEPLLSEPPRAGDYTAFLDRAGSVLIPLESHDLVRFTTSCSPVERSRS